MISPLEYGSLLVQVLADASIKATVVLAAAAVATVLIRSSSASLRRMLWAVALIGGLSLPLLTAVVPELDLPLLPAIEGSSPAVADADLLGDRGDPTEVLTGNSEHTMPSRTAAASRPLAPGHEDRSHETSRSADRGTPWTWVLALWSLGASVALVYQLSGYWRLRRWAGGAEPLRSPRWQRLLAETDAAIRPGRKVRLLASARVPLPMTWGVLHPVVMLPASCSGWSDERARIVLQHELLHVRRGDWLLSNLARWACTLYWFHPLAWFARRRLGIEQELACDDAVLGLGTMPSTYATHLLEIARSLRAARPAMALEMARHSTMEGRLVALLDPDRKRRLSLAAAALVAFMLSLVPAIAAVHPWSGAEPGTARVAEADAGQPAPSQELRAAVADLLRLPAECQPYTERLSALNAEMAPLHARMLAIELEMRTERERLALEELDQQSIDEGLAELDRTVRPYQERLAALARQMEPISDELEAALQAPAPDTERLARLRRSMQPHLEAMHGLYLEMDERLRSMEETHRETEAAQHRLQPFQRRLDQVAAEMEPYRQRMQELQEQMHEEHGALMDEVHHRFRNALCSELETTLRTALAPVVTADAPMTEAAQSIFDRISTTLHEDHLELHVMPRYVHNALEPLRAHRAPGTTGHELGVAFERAAGAVHRLCDTL